MLNISNQVTEGLTESSLYGALPQKHEGGVRTLMSVNLLTTYQRSFYEFKMKTIEDAFYRDDTHKETVLRNSFLMRLEEETIRRESDMATLEVLGMQGEFRVLVGLGVVDTLDEPLNFHHIIISLHEKAKTNKNLEITQEEINMTLITYTYSGKAYDLHSDSVKKYNLALKKMQEYSKLLRKFEDGGVVVSLGDHPLTLDNTLRDSYLVSIKLFDVTSERCIQKHVTSYMDSLVTRYGLKVAYLRSSFNSLKMDFFITPENMRKVFSYLVIHNSLIDGSGVLSATDDSRHFMSYVKLTMKNIKTGEKVVERVYMYV